MHNHFTTPQTLMASGLHANVSTSTNVKVRTLSLASSLLRAALLMIALMLATGLAIGLATGLATGLTAGLTTVTSTTAHAQVVLIAHKSTPAATLDNSSILDIFTLNTKSWSDGGKITLLEIKGDSPAKTKFYAALGTSFVEMQRLWLKKQFSGKGLPPTGIGSEQELIEKVASTPGAVGYVSADNAKNPNVKILATIR
jgi:hypothetical protein